MAVYDFQCAGCGAVQEEKRPMTNPDTPGVCGTCRGETHKVFNPRAQVVIGFRFHRHVNVTGLKYDLGSGPGLDVNIWKNHRGTVVRSIP